MSKRDVLGKQQVPVLPAPSEQRTSQRRGKGTKPPLGRAPKLRESERRSQNYPIQLDRSPGVLKKISRAIWKADGEPKDSDWMVKRDYEEFTELVLMELHNQGYALVQRIETTKV